MSCDDARVLVDAYVDGEIDLLRSLDVEKHIETCASCKHAVEQRQALGGALRDESMYYRAPRELEGKIRKSLEHAGGSARSGRRVLPILAVAAGLLLAAVFLDRLIPFSQNHRAEDLVAQEVLDSHLRSLMPGHLSDVESSDQHTVKPWFNGKLDFSPPVSDFAAQQFSLIGGRLDSIEGRTVAVLIYQRRQHRINVYIWPSSGTQNTEVDSMSRQGYHLLHWARGGMCWWVASDLNDSELRDFGKLLRNQ